jgi:hypothetical protein
VVAGLGLEDVLKRLWCNLVGSCAGAKTSLHFA